ncbi:hypothetical protein [Shewanella gelidii]|uniref:Uncharacterized protein n=1 Tax=Shewanella gelidii TaxID=1642821 RepID=A0A917JXS3_9GAMM|nr:hypothetical protein [Shewanella gelidii]MCL1098092.1 hypothetical protein [Shewanella gelidii]GGI90361.1 hypothetical protein GCM10009332_29680 [Shewanella gelidii]
MEERIEISVSKEKLAELITEQHLCAADITPLNALAKKQIWQMCLQGCKKALSCPQVRYVLNGMVVEEEKIITIQQCKDKRKF